MNKKELLIGLDIGGSKVLGLLYDRQTGKSYAAKRQPISKERLSDLLGQLNVEISRLSMEASRLQSKIAGIGIGIPGSINNGKIIRCPNLPILNGQKLGQLLAPANKINNIILDNDLNCFLRAYLEKHPTLKKQTLIVLALGTGVGGSVAINGQNIIKHLGISSELGHLAVDQSGHDLEYYYHQLTGYPAGRLFTAAEGGNRIAQRKIDQFANILGLVVANLNTIFIPNAIILTGGVSRYHKFYLNQVKKIIKTYSFTNNRPAWRIGHDQKAGAIGASLLID